MKKLLPLILLLCITNFIYAQWHNGQSADLVLGQADFYSQTSAAGATGLSDASGIVIDFTNNKMYVADKFNNRVLRFSYPITSNQQAAEAVLGQADFSGTLKNRDDDVNSPKQNGFNSPRALVIYNGTLWVTDWNNHRVLRFDNAHLKSNGANADGVLGQANFTSRSGATTATGMRAPSGLAMSSTGVLWVANAGSNRILRFDNAASKANGASADGVLGQTDFTSEGSGTTQNNFNQPRGVFLDDNGTLWVADYSNHRVIRFDNVASKTNGANADGVLGQPDFTTNTAATSQTGMRLPQSVTVDGNGSLYVISHTNNRIVIYKNAVNKANGGAADYVLGQGDFTTGLSNLTDFGLSPDNVSGMFTDNTNGYLWVGDGGNNRVLRFSIPKTNWSDAPSAELVLGQSDFTSKTANTGNTGLNGTSNIVIDHTNNKLYVADKGNHRVLRFSYPITSNQQAAEAVFGQTNFTNTSSGTSQSKFNSPRTLAVDNTGRLWVGDWNNNRVLRFDNAHLKSNGANADGVLGQSNFTSGSYVGPSQTSTTTPGGLAVEDDGTLWVSDPSDSHVKRFDNAASKSNGGTADGILGPSSFTGIAFNTTQAHFKRPYGIAVDNSGRLWVADYENNRVVWFNNAKNKSNGANANGVLGQTSYTNGTAGTSQSTMNFPINVTVDDEGRLYVIEQLNNRVLIFEGAAAKAAGANADHVIGQGDFVTNGFRSDRTGMNPAVISGLAYDNTNNVLWVGDTGNNRAVRFGTQTTEWESSQSADIVVGQANFTSNTAAATNINLDGASGVAIDVTNGKMYVADKDNHRVLRYNYPITSNQPAAEIVFGQPDFTSNTSGTTQNTFNSPRAVAIDNNGTLWVAEWNNHRVLRFDNAHTINSNQPNADGVLGQPDFTTASISTISASTLRTPGGLHVNSNGTLWVSGSSRHRVLRFDNAASKANGGAADGVLGQSNFNTGFSSGAFREKLTNPYGVFEDQNGTLWIADASNNRIIRHDNAESKSNNANADGVLGQASFTTNLQFANQAGMNTPMDVAVDEEGRLYVVENGNNRVLIFNNAAGKNNGGNADDVLGQPDFITFATNTSETGLDAGFISSVAFDNTNKKLWVGDTDNNRVVRFSLNEPALNNTSAPTILTSTTTITGLDYAENAGPSSTSSFTVSGTNLTSNITITAPTNFEISTSSGSGFGSSLNIAQSNGTVSSTTIFVRLQSGLSANSYSGNITLSSTGAISQVVSLSGTVSAALSAITVNTNTLTGLDYVEGSGPSSVQAFTVSGSNLAGNIGILAPTNFEISTVFNSGYGSSISLTPSSGTVNNTIIYVRLKAGLSANSYSGNITLTSTGASNKSVSLSGEVSVMPSLMVNPSSLTGLGYIDGSNPVTQSFTVSGSNLTGNVTVSMPTDFVVLNLAGNAYTTSITITPSGGSVNQTVTIRLKPNLSLDSYSGDITVSSTGVTSKTVALSGDVISSISLVINEIHADPASGTAGDANGDGFRHATWDEFIEFYNTGNSAIDLSGYTISDANGVRHTFPNGTTIPAGGFLTVFGNGTPTNIPGVVQTSSTGTLSLDNNGEQLTIKDNLGNTVLDYTYNTSSINDQSTGRSPDFTGNFVAHSGIAGNGGALFSPGALNDGTVLPVELLDFRATVIDRGTLLEWSTASEENNEGFYIERSSNTESWETLGFIEGKGTTLEQQHYSFLDEYPFIGENYYRLKQMDFDGDFEYSDIVNVIFDEQNPLSKVHIFPNPVNAELNVINGEGIAIIYNTLGQHIKKVIINSSQLTINTSGLPKGQYILRIEKQDGRVENQYFIKQ